MLKHITSKATENSNNTEEKTLGQLIKGDFFRILWSISYLVIIGLIVYLTYSALPFLFSQMYASIGVLISMNFKSATNADLIYWAMICLSVGAVVVSFIVILLYKLFKLLTKKIVVKHVFRKES